MKQLIKIHGVDIAYQKLVSDSAVSTLPIIFLHDSLGCISVWRDFPQALIDATKLNGIVYDRQGYGGSAGFDNTARDNSYMEREADFLIAFLNALNIEKCVLFGHSDGGSIALIAGGKYPERFAAIITEGAHVFVEEITLAGIREAQNAYQTSDLKQKLSKHHGDKVDALFKAWTETWLSPPFSKWNIEHFLPAIQCPVLTIYGSNDEYGTLLQADAIQSQVKGISEKLIIPGVGHTAHREAKEITLKAATDFLLESTKKTP